MDPETLRELRALFNLYDIDGSGRKHPPLVPLVPFWASRRWKLYSVSRMDGRLLLSFARNISTSGK